MRISKVYRFLTSFILALSPNPHEVWRHDCRVRAYVKEIITSFDIYLILFLNFGLGTAHPSLFHERASAHIRQPFSVGSFRMICKSPRDYEPEHIPLYLQPACAATPSNVLAKFTPIIPFIFTATAIKKPDKVSMYSSCTGSQLNCTKNTLLMSLTFHE